MEMTGKPSLDGLVIQADAPEFPHKEKKKLKKNKHKAGAKAGEADSEGAMAEKSAKGTDAKRGKLSYDARLSKDEAAAYLEAIASGLRQGRIRMRHENKPLELEPAGPVVMEIHAARKGVRQRFAFEISWPERDAK